MDKNSAQKPLSITPGFTPEEDYFPQHPNAEQEIRSIQEAGQIFQLACSQEVPQEVLADMETIRKSQAELLDKCPCPRESCAQVQKELKALQGKYMIATDGLSLVIVEREEHIQMLQDHLRKMEMKFREKTQELADKVHKHCFGE